MRKATRSLKSFRVQKILSKQNNLQNKEEYQQFTQLLNLRSQNIRTKN